MEKSKTTKMPTRYIFLLVFAILFGLSFFITTPDPDSGPSISCTNLFSCPGAKLVRGLPIPYSFHTDDGINHPQTKYALAMNVPFFLVISALVTKAYIGKQRKGIQKTKT